MQPEYVPAVHKNEVRARVEKLQSLTHELFDLLPRDVEMEMSAEYDAELASYEEEEAKKAGSGDKALTDILEGLIQNIDTLWENKRITEEEAKRYYELLDLTPVESTRLRGHSA